MDVIPVGSYSQKFSAQICLGKIVESVEKV
jgi:hypothetical protein